MRHRVALALLVAICVACCISSTSLDDHVNRKTKTVDEDDEIEESRMFGFNHAKSFVSKLFGGTKNAGVADDVVKNAGTKVDDVGGGVKNAANKADDVGGGALKAAKKGGEVAKVAKKKWSKKKKAVVFTLLAAVVGGIGWYLYRESKKPLVAPTAGGSTAMVNTTGSAMEGSSSLGMDSFSGSAMDDSVGSAMGGFSGSLLDEMAAMGYEGL